jgi:hypothetical protein
LAHCTLGKQRPCDSCDKQRSWKFAINLRKGLQVLPAGKKIPSAS